MAIQTDMPDTYLIEGPVGSGKSTYAMALASRTQGIHIALDEWFASLFSPDRPSGDVIPWYMERKARLFGVLTVRLLTNASISALPWSGYGSQGKSNLALCAW
ncbi:MAG: AAA family ATPase [Natronospirillum sp.]